MTFTALLVATPVASAGRLAEQNVSRAARRGNHYSLAERLAPLAPQEVLPGFPSTGLLVDRWVCVVDRDHPTVGDALTLEDLTELRRVAPTFGGKRLALQLDGLLAHGVEPRIEVSTESFGTVPFLVAGTGRIGLVQEGLAARLADAAGVRVLACPWELPPIHLTMWWDVKRENDPTHQWLRDVVERCMSAIADGSRPS